jgi:hypothetical protein
VAAKVISIREDLDTESNLVPVQSTKNPEKKFNG